MIFRETDYSPVGADGITAGLPPIKDTGILDGSTCVRLNNMLQEMIDMGRVQSSFWAKCIKQHFSTEMRMIKMKY